MIIGCEEFPKSEHGKLLIEDICRFINDQYKYSGKTVVKAFEMASTHSLFLDGKRVDPSTFGKFLSRASVGKVLTAYKEHMKDSNARPQGYDYKALPEAPLKRITPYEAYELCLKWYKKDGVLEYAPVNMAYEYLLENGQVEKIEKVRTNRFEDNFDGRKHKAVENYLKSKL